MGKILFLLHSRRSQISGSGETCLSPCGLLVEWPGFKPWTKKTPKTGSFLLQRIDCTGCLGENISCTSSGLRLPEFSRKWNRQATSSASPSLSPSPSPTHLFFSKNRHIQLWMEAVDSETHRTFWQPGNLFSSRKHYFGT